MKLFVLFLLVVTPNGVSTTATMFEDKLACEAAATALAADFGKFNGSIFNGQLRFYLHCQAVQATEESK